MRAALGGRPRVVQGSSVRGLVARRLLAPGSTRLRMAPTPLGRQVAGMLRDLRVMRTALFSIMNDASDPGTKAHDLALRALARTRWWTS
jgi:hypothetical protein